MDKWLIIPVLIAVGLGQLVRVSVGGLSLPLLDIVVGAVVIVGLISAWGRWLLPPRPVVWAWLAVMMVMTLSWSVNLLGLGWTDGATAGLFLARFVGCGLLPLAIGPHLVPDRLGVYRDWLVTTGVAVAALGFGQLGLFPDLRLFEYLGIDPHVGRLVSTWLDPNLVGIFLGLGVGAAGLAFASSTAARERWTYAVATGFLGVAVLLTFSRSALLALIVVLLFVGWAKYRQWMWLGLLVVAIGFSFIPRLSDRLAGIWQLDTTARYRVESWHTGWQAAKSRPILGVGYNAVGSQRYQDAPAGTEELSTRAQTGFDSTLLTILVAAGWLGLLAWLWWVATLLGWQMSNWRGLNVTSPLVWVATLALFSASWFVNAWLAGPLLVSWWLIVGLSLREHA